MIHMHIHRILLLTIYMCLSTTNALHASELNIKPDKLPFKSWGELRESKGDEAEGRVLDIYAEQGVSWNIWNIEKSKFYFTPFVAGTLKLSNQSEEVWNNHWKTFAGIQLNSSFSGGESQYEGVYGIQFDVNYKDYTSSSLDNDTAIGHEIKVFYYVGADWLKH